jgi:gamma-glutamyltranspeptidase / glutathione hydrolase
LHAWMLSRPDGRPEYAGATPGGVNQVPWNSQLLQGLLDGETAPGILVTAPRWEWLPADDGVRVEAGFAPSAVEELAAAAPRVVPVERWSVPSAQQVITVPTSGEAIVGAADPRTVGAAVGV